MDDVIVFYNYVSEYSGNPFTPWDELSVQTQKDWVVYRNAWLDEDAYPLPWSFDLNAKILDRYRALKKEENMKPRRMLNV